MVQKELDVCMEIMFCTRKQWIITMIKDLHEGILRFTALWSGPNLLTAEEGSKLPCWLFPPSSFHKDFPQELGCSGGWVFGEMDGSMRARGPGSSQGCPERARGNGHKFKYKKFSLNRGKSFFYGESGQALEKVAQGRCGVPGLAVLPCSPLLVAHLWRYLIQHVAGNDS